MSSLHIVVLNQKRGNFERPGFQLNFDSDNAAPSNKTIHQTRPGPAGGLFVEASFKTDEFPWLEQDAHNGFRVYVNHASFTGKYSPVAAPHASEIFVKVTPTMQSVSQNCAPYGHLSGTEFGYHDPKGENCIGQEGAATLIRLSGCATAVYTYKPNASIVCGPMTMYWIGVFSSASALDSMLQKMYMRDDGQPSHAISRKQVGGSQRPPDSCCAPLTFCNSLGGKLSQRNRKTVPQRPCRNSVQDSLSVLDLLDCLQFRRS